MCASFGKVLNLIILALLSFGCAGLGQAQDANRLTYLDEFCAPYYPTLKTAKLTTPQWIGEENVDAVITLGIDDMRDPARYEAYLRPILDRLKKIDGRAPVSIMTCSVDPKHKQLKSWLEEGVSIECHTIDHPCPCLNGGDFARAKSTYDRCVDLMNQIEGNHPVAFRFPCMDSLNTPSPRAFAEIVNQQTELGNHLQISTSVTCLFTPDDNAIKSVFVSGGEFEKQKFKKYVPFPSFVNQIQNYPYPYLIGNKCWEFPCTIPDDWQGQNLQRPHNPVTVADLKAAVDATVIKKGVANIIFHPHAWIRAEQIAEVINHVDRKYGKRVKFLTFKECAERINKHLLNGVSVRHPGSGLNNGIRILDLNNDGYMDVLIGNGKKQIMRIWMPQEKRWKEFPFEFLVDKVRFGILQNQVGLVHQVDSGKLNLWTMNPQTFQWTQAGVVPCDPKSTIADIRLRDLDQDGTCEIIAAGTHERTVFEVSATANNRLSIKSVGSFPVAIADPKGLDNGARFVDLDGDRLDDLIISNDETSAVFLKKDVGKEFEKIKLSTEIPKIVTAGKNGGVWFANQHLWAQHEHTHRLPDGVDRRTFHQILGNHSPRPRAPQAALESFQVAEGFSVELMASEPLVMDPIAIEWGIDGKLWVVEMADYPLGLDDRGKPGGRVRFLEDTDADGTYDKSTLFVEGIPFPTGVLPTNIDPAKPSCLITAAPYVVKANQRTSWSDLIQNRANILLGGFGEGNQQHRFNGFSPGLDNWLYLANGDSGGVVTNPETGQSLDIRGRDLRIKLGDKLLFEAQTGQTQFGRHRDDWGNWFGCSNPLPIRHYLLPDHYTKRNTHYRYPSPRIDLATAGNTQLFPVSRVLSHWSGYQPPTAGQPHRFTSACSTDFYRDDRFGEEFRNNTFTCEPVHNLVHRRILERTGLQFNSRRASSESDHEFLASTDSWFRPTTVKTGPDGALWVVDMYRLVIEHPEWIDDQREKELFLRAGHDKGRIYRIVPKSIPLRAFPAGDWVKDFSAESPLTEKFTNRLLNMLLRSNRWHNETAQRLLVQIGNDVEDQKLGERLTTIAQNKDSALTRLLALCTLDGRNEIKPEHLIRAFADKHPGVRRHAIRISERFLRARQNEDVQAALLRACESIANDPNPQVRMQLAFSLGYSDHKRAAELLVTLGHTDFSNTYLRAAVFSSFSPSNIESVIQKLRPDHNPEFVMAVIELAVDFEKPNLAMQSLTTVLEASDPEKVTTRQLEMVAGCYTAIKSNSSFNDEFKLLADTFDKSLFRSLDNGLSERRTAAIVRLMARSPFRAQDEKISQLAQVIGPQSGIQLQKVAVSELGQIDDAKIGRLMISKWRTVSPAMRTEILSFILQRPNWSTMLLQAIAGNKIEKAEISTQQKNQFLTNPNQQVARLAAELFRSNAGTSKTTTIDSYLNQIQNLKKSANLSKGKLVFDKHCATCHQIGKPGSTIGPDLLAIKDRSLKSLVTAVVDPNQAVEDKYRSYIVALNDGRQLVGVIQSESSNQIRIGTADGKTLVLFRNDIEQMKSTGKSLMPERLDEEISAEMMQNLANYILHSSQQRLPRGKHKSFAGNSPVRVKPSAEGTITLSAATCEIYGPQIVFEAKYQNLGFWGNVDDQAHWKMTVRKPGKYKVVLNYACPENAAGNLFELQVAGKVIKGKVRSTRSWDQYKQQVLGYLELEAGDASATLAPLEPLSGFLLDLKAVELIPVK